MTYGVEADAYMPPHLFISENTIHVQNAGANCSDEPQQQYKKHESFDTLKYFGDCVYLDC